MKQQHSWGKQGFRGKLALGVGMLMLTSVAALSAADFLPLAPGNSWTYQDGTTGSTFKVEVGATQLYTNGRVYHRLRGYTPAQLWVRINEFGNLVYWDDELQAEPMVTAFETGSGGWFEAHARECPEQGQAQEKRVTHDGPGGKWTALEIQYRVFACADAGDISEQFAENIGMIRRVVNTIAGPRTFNLMQARVGTQTVTVGNTGSFSTTLMPHADGATWKITLRVDVPLTIGIKVKFPTSQEFEIRVRDEEGRTVWVYSMDKLFLQAEHERIFLGTWSESVTVPIPPGVPEIQRAYTVDSWITSAPGEPMFAATTNIIVPGLAPGIIH